MTRDDAIRILDNLEVIRHFAEGGDIETCLHNYRGEFVEWHRVKNTLLLGCLGKYRIVKPHIKLTAGKPIMLPSIHLPCKSPHH